MKRRTGLLFSSAVVLGLVGGAVGGFLIQQARPATPLPPYEQTLAAATVPGTADPRDATKDDGAKLDGDLRTVLLAKPATAKDTVDFAVRDWFTKSDLAEYYVKPDSAFTKLAFYKFRRAARTGWTLPDGTDVEIDLIQFRTTEGATAYFGMTHFPKDSLAPPLTGTATGYVGRSYEKDASGLYSAYGLVQHGTVVEQVFVTNKHDVPSEDTVMQITKDQADLL